MVSYANLVLRSASHSRPSVLQFYAGIERRIVRRAGYVRAELAGKCGGRTARRVHSERLTPLLAVHPIRPRLQPVVHLLLRRPQTIASSVVWTFVLVFHLDKTRANVFKIAKRMRVGRAQDYRDIVFGDLRCLCLGFIVSHVAVEAK